MASVVTLKSESIRFLKKTSVFGALSFFSVGPSHSATHSFGPDGVTVTGPATVTVSSIHIPVPTVTYRHFGLLPSQRFVIAYVSDGYQGFHGVVDRDLDSAFGLSSGSGAFVMDPCSGLVADTSGHPVLRVSEKARYGFVHSMVISEMNRRVALDAYAGMTQVFSDLLQGRLPARALLSSSPHLMDNSQRMGLLAANTNQVPSDVEYLDEVETYAGPNSYSNGRSSITFNGRFITTMQLYGFQIRQDNKKNTQGFDASGYGLQAAIMHPVLEHWLLGGYAAWQTSSADIKNFGGDAGSQVYRLGPALSFRYGEFSVEAIATYNWVNNTGKIQGYKEEHRDGQWDAYLRGSYDIHLDRFMQNLTLTPEGQLFYSRQSAGDFNWGNYMVKKGDVNSWVSRLGGLLDYEWEQADRVNHCKINLGWQHSKRGDEDIRYIGSRVKELTFDDNAAYYGAALSTQLSDQWDVDLAYSGIWSSNSLGHHIGVSAAFRF